MLVGAGWSTFRIRVRWCLGQRPSLFAIRWGVAPGTRYTKLKLALASECGNEKVPRKRCLRGTALLHQLPGLYRGLVSRGHAQDEQDQHRADDRADPARGGWIQDRAAAE